MKQAFILIIFLSSSTGATQGIIGDSLGIERDKAEKEIEFMETRGIEIEDLFQSPLLYIPWEVRGYFLSKITLGGEITDEERIAKVRFGLGAFKDTAIVYDKKKKAALVFEKTTSFYYRRYWAAAVKYRGDRWLHYIYEYPPPGAPTLRRDR